MSKQNEPSFDEVRRELEKRVGGTDRLRAEELDRLAATRRAKEASMKRERARLTAKYGADHPRVAAISNRLDANAGLARDLDLEASRARADVPRVEEGAWAVHGHVRDRGLKPLGGLTVALYDARSRWVESPGYACTGGDGYFRIEAKEVAALEGPLYLRVLSDAATPRYADPRALTPTAGAIDSREIILGDGAACVPPFTESKDPAPGGAQLVRPNNPAAGPDASLVGGGSGVGSGVGGDIDVKPGEWVVRGRVTNEWGDGVGGLVVSLFDKDLFFDDKLGQTETDADGYYLFRYRTEDFRDLFERRPDVYLKVLDRRGHALYTSKRKVRYEAGRAETINALVP